MKKKKGIIALVATLIISLLVFSACKPHFKHQGAFMLDYITEVLDLSETQENKLEGIRTEMMAQFEKMHDDKKEMHDTIKVQLTADSIDKDVLRQMVSEHRARKDVVIDMTIEKLADFHADLSPEQRQKLVAKLKKLEQRHCSLNQ